MAFISYLPPERIAAADRVPDDDNIIQIHAVHPRVMQQHYELYRELMVGRSPLTRIQREMVAVVVSAVNSCHY